MAACVPVINAHEDVVRWTDVARIGPQRRVAGAKKKPAMATFEVNTEAHQFLMGEMGEDIALKIDRNARLKQDGGYVPHTELVLKPVCEKGNEDELCRHVEKLAPPCGLWNTPRGTPLVATRNQRMCSGCHSSTEIMPMPEQRYYCEGRVPCASICSWLLQL